LSDEKSHCTAGLTEIWGITLNDFEEYIIEKPELRRLQKKSCVVVGLFLRICKIPKNTVRVINKYYFGILFLEVSLGIGKKTHVLFLTLLSYLKKGGGG
jgi:hypothetical protein